MSLRLALRLIRGGGRQGHVRLLLLALGVAAAIAVALTALAVSAGLSDREHRAQQREPVHASESDADLLNVTLRHEVYRGQPWRRMLVGNVTAQSARPPGVTELPGPGESVVSPSLYAARSDPLIHLRLGKIIGVLGADGLLSPTDLVSYTGKPLSAPFGSVLTWGTSARVASDVPGRVVVQLELLLLVGLPLLLFVRVASRLSASTRANRERALDLVGVPRSITARAVALESAVTAAVGATLGVGVFAAVNSALAGGALGFTWFPSATTPGVPRVVTCGLIAATAAAWLAARATTQAAAQPRRPKIARRAGLLRCLPLAIGLPLLVFSVPLLQARAADEAVYLTLLGVGLSALGVVVAVRPLALALGRRALARFPGTAVRLAVRRLQFEPDATGTIVVAVVSLILLAGVAQAAIHDMQVVSGFSQHRVDVDVRGASLTADQRSRMAQVAHGTALRGELATTPDPVLRNRVVAVHRMPCSGLVEAFGPLPDCRDGRAYRLRDTEAKAFGALSAGQPLDGLGRPAVIPSDELLVPRLTGRWFTSESIVMTGMDPTYPWSENSFFSFRVSAAEAERLEARLLSLAPTGDVEVQGRDVELLTQARLQRGAVQLGLILGLSLGLLGLVVAAIDRVLERRRAVAALVVVGVPLATLRRAQALLLLIPLVAGAVPAVFVSAVSAHRYLVMGGAVDGYYVTPLLWALGMAVAASLAAIATGLVVAGQNPTGPDLRRE